MTRLTVAQARSDVAELERRLRDAEVAKIEKNMLPEDFDVDRASEVVGIDRRDGRCNCGALVDVWEGLERLLVGCNAGTVVWFSRYRCGCGRSASSNYRRVLSDARP